MKWVFFDKLFSDNNGVSSKRIFGGIATIALIIYIFKYPDSNSIEILGWVIGAYITGNVVEKYSKNYTEYGYSDRDKNIPYKKNKHKYNKPLI
jgi:hypothetical protein